MVVSSVSVLLLKFHTQGVHTGYAIKTAQMATETTALQEHDGVQASEDQIERRERELGSLASDTAGRDTVIDELSEVNRFAMVGYAVLVVLPLFLTMLLFVLSPYVYNDSTRHKLIPPSCELFSPLVFVCHHHQT